jgi:hypothetical protein
MAVGVLSYTCSVVYVVYGAVSRVVTISVADSTARIVQYVDVYVPVGSESEDMVSFVAPQAKSLKVQNSLQG